MRLLQVCNVGNILGGTAACAWTVTRALPQMEHAVVFLSRVTDETRRAFAHCRVERWERVDDARLTGFAPEAVILHNTRPQCVGRLASAVTMQYVHSAGPRAAADVTVSCSRWLAEQRRGCIAHGLRDGRFATVDDGPWTTDMSSRKESSPAVLYQAVPKPPRPMNGETRTLRDHLVIGRVCSPQSKKWPTDVPAFYEPLAQRFPSVGWEFVGCPAALQPGLSAACGGRATFHAASRSARSCLWTWDALLYHNVHVTESFGRTVAEGMRAGCIPIVDARGGFLEQVVDGVGALCGSDEEFAAAIERLLDAGGRRRMSRAAMHHADTAFGLERFGSNLTQVIRGAA